MRHHPRLWFALIVTAVALFAVPPMIGAQQADEVTVDEDAREAPSDDAGDAERSAREVMDQLIEQRRESPAIEPTRKPHVEDQPSRVGAPAATVDLDPAIVGTAPDGEQPDLLPEGTFVVNRRGRLMRSPDGGHVMFAFAADDADAPEAPMILQPCRKLEDMEDYVEKHGDQSTFRLSGQVHTYRGANYLLPTMMVIDLDRGNLQP